MLSEKDKANIALKNKKLLKLFLTFVVVDILSILFIKNFFNDFNVLRYTYIRVLFISFSLSVYTLKQLMTIFNRLLNLSKVFKENGIPIKNTIKVLSAIIEVGILFGIQSGMIVYFRSTFYTATSYNILLCLFLVGTLIYISRVYLNKKYNI